MATLYITEFQYMENANDIGGVPQIAKLPGVASQTVAISGSSAQSSAFNVLTRFVRVTTDIACHVAVGANPTATTSLMRMGPDSVEYFGVTPGHKLAVIAGA